MLFEILLQNFTAVSLKFFYFFHKETMTAFANVQVGDKICKARSYSPCTVTKTNKLTESDKAHRRGFWHCNAKLTFEFDFHGAIEQEIREPQLLISGAYEKGKCVGEIGTAF